MSSHYRLKLSNAHPPHLRYPCQLQARVRGTDVGVEPASAGRDGVGWDDGNGRRSSPNRGDHPVGVVLAVAGTLDRNSFPRREKGLGGARLVDTDGAGDRAGEPVLVEDSEHRTNPVVGAERTPTINTLQTADILAPETDLAEQALASGRLLRPGGSLWVGKCVDDVLGAEVGGRGRGRVVAVTGRRRAGLEVLHERLAVLVEEGLADEPASHRCPRVRPGPAEQGSVSAAMQAWQLGHRCYG
jgi:hypothetical protein